MTRIASDSYSAVLVWEVCDRHRYAERNTNCNHCPPMEHDEHHGAFTRGCYVIAEGTVKLVLKSASPATRSSE